MKKAILCITAILVTVSQLMAGGPFSGEKDKAIILNLDGWKTETVDIRIKDNKGNTLHMEELRLENNAKRINFKKLTDGKYSIVTSNEYKVRTQVFNVSNNGLELVAEHFNYKPLLTYKEGYWDINFLSSNSKAFVSVYNSSGKEVYNTQYNERCVNRRININNLPNGLYTILVSNGIVSSSQQINK